MTVGEARRAVTLGIVFLIPITFAPGVTWDAFNVPKLALLVAGCSIALCLRMVEGDPVRPGARTVLIPIAAFGAPLLLSWLVGPYKGWTFLGQYTSYQGLLPFLAILLLAFLCADVFEDAAVLARAIVGGCSIVALYAIMQGLGLDPIDWGSYGTILPGGSMMGNPNFSASLFAVSLPVAVGLLAGARRLLAGAAVAVLGAGLMASGGEGAALGALAGSAVALGGIARRVTLARRATGIVVALCPLILVGIVGFGLMQPDWAEDHLSVRDRGWYWVAAGGMLLDHPVVGRGPDSFAIEGVRYRLDEEGVERDFSFTFDPHSSPLMHGASNGLPAVMGFAFLALWIGRRWSAPGIDATGIAAVAGGTAYLVQSLWSADQLGVRAIFWVLLAIVAIQTSNRRERRVAKPSNLFGRATLAIMGVVIAAAGLSWAWRLLSADSLAYSAVQLDRAGDRIGAAQALVAAVDRAGLTEHRKMLGIAFGNIARVTPSDPHAFLEGARDAFAYTRDLPDVDALAAYGRALHESAGGHADIETEALGLFERAIAIDGLNPLLRVGAADVLISLDRPEEAHEVLEPLFYGFPPQPEFWGALALANARARDWSTARNYLDHAISLGPLDPRGAEALELIEAHED